MVMWIVLDGISSDKPSVFIDFYGSICSDSGYDI